MDYNTTVKRNQKAQKNDKNTIYTIITNIQQNNEYDETYGLDMGHTEDFLDSLFPKNIQNKYIKNIKSQFYDMKNFIGNQKENKFIFDIII